MTFILGMASLHSDARPRHLVFSKIERLISHMNDQRNGVQLKDKKNFLHSTMHNSFTGADLISWLSENRCEQDNAEAIHLATFLCMFGYIYPVDLRTFSVKEDKNIYYRFQSPYYWPSKHLKLTNEMYIIYLLKRNRRNKQKHALEEHEQSALTKLQALFSDKIGFVNKQAEEQVKIVKEMKREDKIIHDKQERAFWKVHRPPPGQVKYVDEGPSRCYQPSQMVARRTKNRDLKIKEIAYLKKALTQARMKFSKSVDIFLQHCDQYMPYDAFMDPGAVQPSNPWISGEETLWEVNGKLVEVPSVLRIKKWALSFEDLLHDDTGRNEFEQFARKEYSQENITFYKTCKEIVVCPLSKVNTLKVKIEKEFLTPGAPCEVNVDGKTLERVQEQLKNDKEPLGRSRYVFQPAMEHVYALMKKDSYARFLRSEQYKLLMEKAQNHVSKKKLFNFGGSKKKSASPLVGRRGSSSSDGQGNEGDLSGPSYHSFSTGNLRELDDNPKKTLRNSYVGSDSSIYMGTYHGQSISPSLRRRNDKDQDSKTPAGQDPRRRSNLEVPRASYAGMTNTESRKSEMVSPCLALNVPRTNVITPWDGKS